MIEPSDQTLKVGQGDLDVGQVLRFPSLDERKINLPKFSISLKDRDNLPSHAGIYLVVAKNAILYVGQGVNLQKRWASHDKLNFLEQNYPDATINYELIESREERNREERRLIRLHVPKLNGIQLLDGERTNFSRNKGHKATGRNREHLTQSEIDILLNRAKSTSQNGTRNHCIVLLGYRHGLRVSEIAALKWSDVDWNRGTLYINRSKGSISGTHPMQGDEMRALRKLQRDYPDTPFLFVDRTHAPLDSKAISKMIKRLGDGDKALGFPIHAHMLRHTCGFLMCDRGYDLRLVQAWLGHSNIQNTVVYTALSSKQFDKVSW